MMIETERCSFDLIVCVQVKNQTQPLYWMHLNHSTRVLDSGWPRECSERGT